MSVHRHSLKEPCRQQHSYVVVGIVKILLQGAAVLLVGHEPFIVHVGVLSREIFTQLLIQLPVLVERIGHKDKLVHVGEHVGHHVDRFLVEIGCHHYREVVVVVNRLKRIELVGIHRLIFIDVGVIVVTHSVLLRLDHKQHGHIAPSLDYAVAQRERKVAHKHQVVGLTVDKTVEYASRHIVEVLVVMNQGAVEMHHLHGLKAVAVGHLTHYRIYDFLRPRRTFIIGIKDKQPFAFKRE